MKNFLFALLALAGCASTSVQPTTPQEDPVPVIVSRSTNGFVDWSCKVDSLNDKLVWINCEFHNNTPHIASACIKVTFYNEMTMNPVTESRKFCSGPLPANENQTNYAAFIKEKRQALQRCGEQLNLCVMLAGNAQK